MPRVFLFCLAVIIGVLLLLAPAFAALSHYGALPRHADRPVTLLLGGATPNYPPSPVWPYPAAPEDYHGITDTLVLAQAWPNGTVNLLSIPRDTWMKIPHWGWGKINGANPHGGPELLMNAVHQLTGLPIDGYALLSLYGLRSLNEAVGGVILNVPMAMKYDDRAAHLHINLQPGRQRLDGVQAEGFLRFRHDNLGDIGRVRRQQQYLDALVSQIKRPVNWWRLPRMIAALDQNTKTNLTRDQVGAVLGSVLKGINVQMYQLPGTFGRAGTWVPDRVKIAQVIREHFIDPNDPAQLKIAVVNLAAPPGSARQLKAKLEGLGYQNVTVTLAPRHPEMLRTMVSGEKAPVVIRDLGFGQVTPAEGFPGMDVMIRLGRDTSVFVQHPHANHIPGRF